jgi:hypothetical protein
MDCAKTVSDAAKEKLNIKATSAKNAMGCLNTL